MKFIILTTLLTFQLFAINPNVYAALGNKLYDNVENIAKLQDIEEFEIYRQKIQEYYYNVQAVKNDGFMIDDGNSKVSKKDYLKKLRKLSKTNDFFVATVNAAFQKSIKDKDSLLFINTVNSGLINTTKYKKEIKTYYYAHKEEIDISGSVIEKFVNEDIRNRKKVYRGPTKEELEKEKIRRIRAKDKAKQEAIAKSIEEELLRKKRKIREEQKKELRTK